MQNICQLNQIKSSNALQLPFEALENNKLINFRPIHYLGSKFRILAPLGKILNELAPNGEGICDLFAGSGTVSRFLATSNPVTSVDVQEYSRIICSAVLNPITLNKNVSIVKNCLNSQLYQNLSSALSPLIDYENYVTMLAASGESNPLCEFLESASLIRYEIEGNKYLSKQLSKALKQSIDNLKKINLFNGNKSIASLYFGGLYFSFQQAIQIDVILESIHHFPAAERDFLLAPLLSTSSEAVNTVGKQFAQPLKPRTSTGEPKNNLAQRVEKDRCIDIFYTYEKWLKTYTQLEKTNHQHTIIKNSYEFALDDLHKSVKVIYADPPYTRDHYSRYYHVLETLALRDRPNISKVKINNKLLLSRALYREERHQSPFCIKSKSLFSFEELFKKSSANKCSLVLSYSPFEEGERPRVVTMDQLNNMAKKYFNKISIETIDQIQHSKLNKKDKLLNTNTPAEIVLICRN